MHLEAQLVAHATQLFELRFEVAGAGGTDVDGVIARIARIAADGGLA